MGGSIVHSANLLMVDYLDICGLKKKQGKGDEGGGNGAFSLHRDGEVVWQESENYYINAVRMIWRYGLFSLIKLGYFVGNLLSNFASIYPRLEAGEGFQTVEEILVAMSPVSRKGSSSSEMVELTKVSIEAKLLELGLSPSLVEELAVVASRVNYGQFPSSLHGFVGAVGLAGVEGGLWSVEGGNFRVAQCALQRSGAGLLRARVTGLEGRQGGGYTLRYSTAPSSENVLLVEGDEAARMKTGEEEQKEQKEEQEELEELEEQKEQEEEEEREEFDVVVVAAPQTLDKTRISGLPPSLQFPGHYHRTVATVVHGDFHPEAVNSTTRINFFLSPSSPIVSISPLTPVDYSLGESLPSVYKLFSSRPLEMEELEQLFSPIHSVQVADWLAYPEYSLQDDLNSFILAPGLYHTSRIEWAASAMEMSVLSARNVANLVANQWGGKEEVGGRQARQEL